MVRRANNLEMVVVLAVRKAGAQVPVGQDHRVLVALRSLFKSNPNVIFDAFMEPDPSGLPDAHGAKADAWRSSMSSVIHAIRATGAAQPIVAMSWNDAHMFKG